MGTGQETTQYDFGCTCLWQCTQRHVTITPTSPKEPRLGYTLLHTWQKKLSISKFHKNLSNICKMRKTSTTINTRSIVRMSQRTMDKTEELFLQNISRYSISLTKSSKLNKKNKPNKKKKKQKKKNKSNNMFHNIINRQLGNANAMTRLKGQGQLIHLTKSIQEIDIGQLSEHLKHIHDLNEAMDVVHDTLSDVWTYSLNHHHLLQIADVFECRLTVDWRYSD